MAVASVAARAKWRTHSCVPRRHSWRRLPRNADIDALGRWLESAALTLGFEAQPAETTYADFESDFPNIGPALIMSRRIPAPNF